MSISRQELLRRRTPRFCARLALAAGIISCTAAVMLSGSSILFILGLAIQGAMYIHLIELQHSVLHLHAFQSHKITRIVGVMLGLPMMISFSDFQYRHLKHHKMLGSKYNTETFDYQHTQLNSITGFLRATFDYSRWLTVARRLRAAWTGENISDGENPLMEQRIREEYRLFGIVLAIAVLLSLATATFWPLILWLAPLVAAEPVHFLLELPEHFGLPAHTNPNVFENTRTWHTSSWFAMWFTHNTPYHVAHHYDMLIPMDNLPLLQKQIDTSIPDHARSKSYFHFYVAVIRGEIRPDREAEALLKANTGSPLGPSILDYSAN